MKFILLSFISVTLFGCSFQQSGGPKSIVTVSNSTTRDISSSTGSSTSSMSSSNEARIALDPKSFTDLFGSASESTIKATAEKISAVESKLKSDTPEEYKKAKDSIQECKNNIEKCTIEKKQ